MIAPPAVVAEVERLRLAVQVLEQRIANQAETIRYERCRAASFRDAFERATGTGWQLDLEGFAERLRTRRQALGWGQADLAKHIGVSNSAVSMWELGRAHPRWPVVPRLAEALGVTAAELLGEVRVTQELLP